MCRTKMPIDWKLVDDLLMAGCLGTELAATFAMHPHTFYDRVAEQYKMTFTEYAQKMKASGEAILRQAQFLKATGKTKKGDNTLLIWLGKQRLGQKDSPNEIEFSKESMKSMGAVMDQLSSLQKERKSAQTSDTTDAKSE